MEFKQGTASESKARFMKRLRRDRSSFMPLMHNMLAAPPSRHDLDREIRRTQEPMPPLGEMPASATGRHLLGIPVSRWLMGARPEAPSESAADK
jgi:hypothetical protein